MKRTSKALLLTLASAALGLELELAAPEARAELAVSANDNKLILVNGVPTIVQNPAPDTVAVMELGASPPRLLAEIVVPASVVGPPLSVAISPDQRIALVTSSMKIDPADPKRQIPDNRMSVIDLVATPPRVIATLETGKGPAGLSISRDGRLALVANRSEGTVTVFRVFGHTVTKADTVVIAAPESGVSHVAIAPDGRSALVTRDGDHTISMLSINGHKVELARRDFGVGLRPYGIVITPDGRSAVVANLGMGRGDHDTISLIDLTLQPPRVVDTFTVPQTPEGLTLSPDGKLCAVITMNGSNKPKESPFYSPVGRLVLFRVRSDNLSLLSDAAVGAWPQGATFSQDAKLLLVQSMIEKNIMVLSVDADGILRDTGQRIPVKGGAAAIRIADRPAATR